MSFFDSILSPFKSVLGSLAPVMPALGGIAGGIFGGPGGAMLGSQLGGIGSQLFGGDQQAQQQQQQINQNLPSAIQNSNFGNLGQNAGSYYGGLASQRAGQMMGPAGNSSFSNFAQNAGNNAGNWLAGKAQSMMPSFMQGTPMSQNFSDFFKNAGNMAGNWAQNKINQAMPSSMSPYANTRFSSLPAQIGSRAGSAFDNASSRYMPAVMPNMTVGNAIPQMSKMNESDFHPDNGMQGLAGMGYAHGGRVDSHNPMYYGQGGAIPSMQTMPYIPAPYPSF